jgi:uncharacterized RDD family membrane protein YckC
MEQTRTYELAGLWQRFFAFAIDSIILSIVGGIIGLNVDLTGTGLASIVIAGGYLWYFWTHHNGQTPGKMFMNIRVIKTNGQPFEDADAILRYVGYLISAPIIAIGFLWAFIDSENQGWHDKIAGTYVVKVPPRKAKNDTVVV